MLMVDSGAPAWFSSSRSIFRPFGSTLKCASLRDPLWVHVLTSYTGGNPYIRIGLVEDAFASALRADGLVLERGHDQGSHYRTRQGCVTPHTIARALPFLAM